MTHLPIKSISPAACVALVYQMLILNAIFSLNRYLCTNNSYVKELFCLKVGNLHLVCTKNGTWSQQSFTRIIIAIVAINIPHVSLFSICGPASIIHIKHNFKFLRNTWQRLAQPTAHSPQPTCSVLSLWLAAAVPVASRTPQDKWSISGRPTRLPLGVVRDTKRIIKLCFWNEPQVIRLC